MMKAYEMGPQKGLESLRLVERETPVPGAGEILVKVHAACLNHRDLLALRSQYGAVRAENSIPLSDGVGSISAVGEDVSGLSEGQRVIAPHFVGWIDGDFSPAIFGNDIGISRNGWLAEYIILPADGVVIIPDSVTDEVAATLASAGTTVWNCVVAFGGLKAGDLVLTLGTGGVSIFTLQIAKALGAKVAITSSSDDKLEQCKAMGADYVANYRKHSDWADALMQETGGRGADIIVDTAGMVSIEQALAAAAPNGRIAMIGGLAGLLEKAPNMFGVIGKNLTLKGITSGSREMLAELLSLVESSAMVPLVDRKFAFDDAASAYRYLDQGDHMGKVMITF